MGYGYAWYYNRFLVGWLNAYNKAIKLTAFPLLVFALQKHKTNQLQSRSLWRRQTAPRALSARLCLMGRSSTMEIREIQQEDVKGFQLYLSNLYEERVPTLLFT